MPPTVLRKNRKIMRNKSKWSEQKKIPLVKPLVDYSTDSWVLLVLGLFDATHMMQLYYKIVSVDIQMKWTPFMKAVLVDKDFRDVANFSTTNKKLHVYCPELGQLDIIEANISRFVTKCRWMIEQLFGRLKKKFKIFSLPAHNATLTIMNLSKLLLPF